VRSSKKFFIRAFMRDFMLTLSKAPNSRCVAERGFQEPSAQALPAGRNGIHPHVTSAVKTQRKG
jgi:hypothetical protein